MLSEDILRRAMRGAELPDGAVHYEEVLDSTNDRALRLAAGGAPEWTLVAAGHQTSGRGRLGRRWESVAGASLLFSVVLRPRLPANDTPILTLLAGAALASACREVLGAPVTCKWPNDILVGEAKVGGILADARVAGDHVDHVVLGVGVNVGSAPDVEGAGAMPEGDRALVLSSFLSEFASEYRYGRGRTLVARTLRRYRPLCATLGRAVRVQVGAGETVEGVAEDLDERGSLLVRTAAGPVTVGFGEVVHIRT